jgi:hypothetical protein
MRTIPFIVIISLLFASAAIADTITVLDQPAGIYDALHAKLAVDQNTGRAYVKVILMDESSYSECWGNQSAMQGIGSDNCRVSIQRVAVPGPAYDANKETIIFEEGIVDDNALVSDMHYADLDDGVSINTVKHVRVQLQKP